VTDSANTAPRVGSPSARSSRTRCASTWTERADGALILRRLDRLDQAMARDHHDLELLSDGLGIRTPGVPEGAKPAARQAAEVQWKQFVAHLADRFSDGHRFTDGLPQGGDGGEAERGPA
jgi:hypothetical protein